MGKIQYDKKVLTGKLVGRGGPRDIQARQQQILQEEMLKQVVGSRSTSEVDLSQYLPLSEVRKKIEDAVNATTLEAAVRYEHELSNLRSTVKELRATANTKDVIISQQNERILLLESSLQSMGSLQDKLESLYLKIADGSIKPLVGSHMNRPELEDKIFIDPLGPGDTKDMDSHIDIKEEFNGSKDRSITADVEKLRSLLKK